jgi:cytochrome c553
VAEGAPLLREYVGKTCIEGSNPSDSASMQTSRPAPGRLCFLCWLLRVVLVLLVWPPAAHAVDDITRRMQACTLCHGQAGRATNAGYFPRIAGKPAGYLFNQLVNFRDGRRPNAVMAGLVEHMSDDYLREIAGYFAALDLPYPPPQTRAAPAALLERGARLVRDGDLARGLPACTACHGARLTGVLPAMPGLLGLPRDYLAAQLGGWRTGQRRAATPDCMAQLAQKLSLDELDAVTAWLSAQPVPSPSTAVPDPGTPLPIACGGGSR